MLKIIDTDKLILRSSIDISKCKDLITCEDCRKRRTMECPSRGLLEQTIGGIHSRPFCSSGERLTNAGN